MSGSEVTSTRERVDGLLRLEGDRVVIQWRLARTTERVGRVIRTDREMDAVREVVLPLSALAGARVRRAWFRWPPGTYLHLTAADLAAFEELARPEAFRLRHPAELIVRVAADTRILAHEFAAELELALAERAIERADRLTGSGPLDALPAAAPRQLEPAQRERSGGGPIAADGERAAHTTRSTDPRRA